MSEEIKFLQRAKAIRTKCLECCNGQAPEVRKCEIISCALHPWRFGRKPTEEEMKQYIN